MSWLTELNGICDSSKGGFMVASGMMVVRDVMVVGTVMVGRKGYGTKESYCSRIIHGSRGRVM